MILRRTAYRRGLLAAVPLALVSPQAALAQGEASPIVVTGRGPDDTPAVPVYDVQTVSREDLLRAASGRIEDALSGIAGFQQFRRSDSRSANPSAQGVTLRALGGNATSRALVLLDGVPMADPFFGYVPLSALAPDRLASARVTRGGGNGAFGAGAVAGTIELTSADAATLGLFNASMLGNTRGETELAATLAPQLGEGFAVIGARWERGDGFWTTPASQRAAASVPARYESWSGGVRAAAPLADAVELQAHVLAWRDGRTLRFAGADSTSEGQDASLRIVGRGPWAFDVLAYAQVRDFSNVVISSATFRKSLDQFKTPSSGFGGKAELRPPVGENAVVRLGVDWRRGSGTMRETAFNATTGAVTARRTASGRNDDIGFYAESDLTRDTTVLTLGLRADRWTIADGSFLQTNAAGAVTANTPFADRSGWEGTFRGGLRHDAGGGWSLRLAGYTGIRLPTLNELYRPFVVFPVTTQANAALKRERLRGVEAGIEYNRGDDLRLAATLFDDRLTDAIANVTVATNTRQRQNVPAIHARGVELSADARIAAQWRFNGSLSLTDATVRGSGASAALNGLRPAQTPRLAASATLAWQPSDQTELALTVRHTGAQYEDDLQTDVLPAATTVDAYATIPLNPLLSFVLRGENLLNKEVYTRNQAGSIDLGVPRTVWAGVRVRLP